MDEHTFQDELRQLKQRLFELTTASQQRLPSVPVPRSPTSDHYGQDHFVQQLQNLKAQLHTMQASLTLHHWPQNHMIDRLPSQPRTTDISGLINFPVHGTTTLPSGPIFWQLISALKTDVRQIDGRVAGLERSFSELEDRVDGLDPKMFTPPGSVADSGTPAMPACSEHSGAVLSESDTGYPTSTDKGVTYQGCEYVDCHIYYPLPDTSHGAVPKIPDVKVGYEELAQLPLGVHFRDKEIAKLDDLLRDANDASRAQEDQLSSKDNAIASLTNQLWNVNATAATWERISHELQDELKGSDLHLNEVSDESNTWRMRRSARCEEQNARNQFDQRIEIACLEYEKEIATLSSIFDRHEADKHLLRRSLERKCAQVVSQASALDVQDEEITYLRHVIEAQDTQIANLSTFCERKDVVASQQQDIIARGQEMLQARDAEDEIARVKIVELEMRLKSANDHLDDLIITLGRRDAEIMELNMRNADVEVDRWSPGRDATCSEVHVGSKRPEHASATESSVKQQSRAQEEYTAIIAAISAGCRPVEEPSLPVEEASIPDERNNMARLPCVPALKPTKKERKRIADNNRRVLDNLYRDKHGHSPSQKKSHPDCTVCVSEELGNDTKYVIEDRGSHFHPERHSRDIERDSKSNEGDLEATSYGVRPQNAGWAGSTTYDKRGYPQAENTEGPSARAISDALDTARHRRVPWAEDDSGEQGGKSIEEPFARAVRNMSEGVRHPDSSTWAPPSNRRYSRLPHEERRARVWEQDAVLTAGNPTHHQFGVASPLNSTHRRQRSHADRTSFFRTAAEGVAHDKRSLPTVGHEWAWPDHVPQDADSARRHAMHSTTLPSEGIPADMPTGRRYRRKLPLDATMLPTLPVPVSPLSRMESMPDMRASRREKSHRSDRRTLLAKHASLAELPKRRLQAYAETEEEAEGGRDRADDSLLD